MKTTTKNRDIWLKLGVWLDIECPDNFHIFADFFQFFQSTQLAHWSVTGSRASHLPKFISTPKNGHFRLKFFVEITIKSNYFSHIFLNFSESNSIFQKSFSDQNIKKSSKYCRIKSNFKRIQFQDARIESNRFEMIHAIRQVHANFMQMNAQSDVICAASDLTLNDQRQGFRRIVLFRED